MRLSPEQWVEFNVNDDGLFDSLTIMGNNNLRAERLEDWVPEAAELLEYTGTYFSPELDAVYTVSMTDDGLVLQHRRHDDIELIPKVTDAFSGSAVMSEVRFIRNEGGRLTGLMGSNVRTIDVWFEKQD